MTINTVPLRRARRTLDALPTTTHSRRGQCTLFLSSFFSFSLFLFFSLPSSLRPNTSTRTRTTTHAQRRQHTLFLSSFFSLSLFLSPSLPSSLRRKSSTRTETGTTRDDEDENRSAGGTRTRGRRSCQCQTANSNRFPLLTVTILTFLSLGNVC
jgi:hypothetical protein